MNGKCLDRGPGSAGKPSGVYFLTFDLEQVQEIQRLPEANSQFAITLRNTPSDIPFSNQVICGREKNIT